jgi:hypothetical protein
MDDDLLALETSSAEEACWLAAAEADREHAALWVRRAQAIAAGYAKAAAAGRAEFVALEVACALQVDHVTAGNVLAEARQLVELPQVADAVEAGALRLSHARALLDQLLPLEPALAAQVADDVLSRVGDRTPAQVRGIAKRAVLRADPQAGDRRRAQAVAQRRMFLRPLEDGMMSLELHLKAETALRIFGVATDATRVDDGSGRTAEQRRVDWVAEQILTERARVPAPRPAEPDLEPAAGPGAEDPTVPDRRHRRPWQGQVVVPIAVGLGLSEEPCELVGYGPITAEHGRELLAEAELRKVCVDSRTGQVLAADAEVHRPVADDAADAAGDCGAAREQALAEAVRAVLVGMVLTPSFEPADPEPQYRPSAHLERTVQLRDVTCDFPFSTTPARRCDTDHTRPYDKGGTTELINLGSRYRRIHRAKQAGWTPRPDADGSLLWQSPSGASYRRPPPREKPPTLLRDAVLPPVRPPRRDHAPPPDGVTAEDPPTDPPTNDPPGSVTPQTRPRADEPPPF